MYPTIKTVKWKTKDGPKVRKYLQIVESKRVNGKPTHEVIASLGQIPDDEEMALKVAKTIIRHFKQNDDDEDAELIEGRHFGAIAVLRKVWKQLGMDRVVNAEAKKRKFKFSLDEALFCMVANRLIAPTSKLGCAEWLSREVYFPTQAPLDADHLYRTLGWLEEVKDDLELRLFKERQNPDEEPVVVFWDTTTTWFEGRGPEGLAEFGRPRPGEPSGRRKILVGLARTRDGWPITHEVFAGNTADVKTVGPLLRRLKDLFGITRCIWVTDRGMISKANIELLEELEYEYVLATKLRGDKVVKEEVLSRAGRYKHTLNNLHVKEVWIDDKRYVVCRNPRAVERDRKRREDILERLRANLKKGDKVDSQHGRRLSTHRAFRRYLDERDGRLVISTAKVNEDARYDGKWVLRCNIEGATAVEIATVYKEESSIERDFRDIKSFYELRPVRHYKEEHVRGHVMVCVLAKFVERELRGRLHANGFRGTSVDAVLEELHRIQVSKLILPNADVKWLRSRLKNRQKDLLARLDLSTKSLPSSLPDYTPTKVRKVRLDNASTDEEVDAA